MHEPSGYGRGLKIAGGGGTVGNSKLYTWRTTDYAVSGQTIKALNSVASLSLLWRVSSLLCHINCINCVLGALSGRERAKSDKGSGGRWLWLLPLLKAARKHSHTNKQTKQAALKAKSRMLFNVCCCRVTFRIKCERRLRLPHSSPRRSHSAKTHSRWLQIISPRACERRNCSRDAASANYSRRSRAARCFLRGNCSIKTSRRRTPERWF